MGTIDQDFLRKQRLARLEKQASEPTEATLEQAHNTSQPQPPYSPPKPQPHWSREHSPANQSTVYGSRDRSPANQSTVPRSRDPVPRPNSPPNITTLSSLRESLKTQRVYPSSSSSSSTTRLASNSSSTRVITTRQELYVRLPSFDITSQQLVQFVLAQFGVEIVVEYINTKRQKARIGNDERTFCFISCKSAADYEVLLRDMNDSVIGGWEDPIHVKIKKDHDS